MKKVFIVLLSSMILSGCYNEKEVLPNIQEVTPELAIAKAFDLVKIRLAYGESGNLTGIGAYSRFNTYSSNSFLGRRALNSSSTLANENVKQMLLCFIIITIIKWIVF